MKSILIVDDDPVYARMVREWVKDDYQAFVVVSGEQMLKFLTKRKTDLILLDYEMSGMSGPQTLTAMRENPETADIKVIFLSGAADDASINEIRSLNTAGFIPKTTTKDNLQQTIRDVLGE
ncbi:MAG: response regulator [Eubacterium sp.]|nr:response regulator [Eubacterium sp.]